MRNMMVKGPDERGRVTVDIERWTIVFFLDPEKGVRCELSITRGKSTGNGDEIVVPRHLFLAARRAARERFQEANHFGRLFP